MTLGIIAVRLGADGNGDLRNYHYYGGWALFNKHVGFDLAPGQLQTYHHPLLDAIFYRLVRWLNNAPLAFTFVWSIPQAVAVWIAFHIARLCFAALPVGGTALALAAALIGGSSAATIAVVGTSMSEGVCSAILLGGVWLVLSTDRAARMGGRMWPGYAAAGALAGTAAVLKLTTVPYLVGFGAAIVALKLLEPRLPRLGAVLAFGAGAVFALALLGLPWWIAVARAFGNPLYPYYNAIFHSPYYLDENLFDRRFLPRTALEWLTYPALWAFWPSTRGSETEVRDPRLLFGLIAAAAFTIWAGLARMRGRVAPPALVWCAVFALVSYGAWLKTFSILRYASVLEMLSGVLVVAALAIPVAGLAPRLVWPRAVAGLALAAGLIAISVLPRWERRPDPGRRLVDVHMRELPPDSTVILLGPVEGAFLAPFEPRSVRFIGLNNNLIDYRRTIGIETLIAAAIDGATGAIWSVSAPGKLPSEAAKSLERFGLRRTDDCSDVASTIAPMMALCRIERIGRS